MKLFQCARCDDIIKLKDTATACKCGAVVGAKVGHDLYSISGNGVAFNIPDNAINNSTDGHFVGVIDSTGIIKLGPKTHLPNLKSIAQM